MNKRISVSITPESKHNALVNYIKLGKMLAKKSKKMKTKPTERVGIALEYAINGLNRSVSFGDPVEMSDDPKTNLIMAMDFYRTACALGIRIGEEK